jgi:hypothetical protein
MKEFPFAFNDAVTAGVEQVWARQAAGCSQKIAARNSSVAKKIQPIISSPTNSIG